MLELFAFLYSLPILNSCPHFLSQYKVMYLNLFSLACHLGVSFTNIFVKWNLCFRLPHCGPLWQLSGISACGMLLSIFISLIFTLHLSLKEPPFTFAPTHTCSSTHHHNHFWIIISNVFPYVRNKQLCSIKATSSSLVSWSEKILLIPNVLTYNSHHPHNTVGWKTPQCKQLCWSVRGIKTTGLRWAGHSLLISNHALTLSTSCNAGQEILQQAVKKKQLFPNSA